MLPDHLKWIAVEFEPEGDPRPLFAIARGLEEAGNLEGAATVYDRAFGLDPDAEDVRAARGRVLERLAVVEHGLTFRYIPGGFFLMGCDRGEPDERPWHPVWLAPFWLSETPLSWAAYCRLMEWEPPPSGFPPERLRRQAPEGEFDRQAFHLAVGNKIRLQYCEDRTRRARDWHSHMPPPPDAPHPQGQGLAALFGSPARDDPAAPWTYEDKPMVAIGWQDAAALGDRLSTPGVRYGLPTEAQWEKAARGGLIGARYAWGNEHPDASRCDFDRFGEFSILPMKHFPPNDYGLYAMNGGVWEWTRDWYDADYYRRSADSDPEGPAQGQEKVLRGGSWADCAQVVTVTFRMSRASASWTAGDWGGHASPNLGFRLCRQVVSPDAAGQPSAALARPVRGA
jgi:formylglycine-generating enzyme required for sulfatase activity